MKLEENKKLMDFVIKTATKVARTRIIMVIVKKPNDYTAEYPNNQNKDYLLELSYKKGEVIVKDRKNKIIHRLNASKPEKKGKNTPKEEVKTDVESSNDKATQ